MFPTKSNAGTSRHLAFVSASGFQDEYSQSVINNCQNCSWILEAPPVHVAGGREHGVSILSQIPSPQFPSFMPLAIH